MEEKNKQIYFYKKNQKHGYLSNFYESPFQYKNKLYPTNQHFFQSQKFVQTPQHQAKIINAKTPFQAFTLGRSKQYKPRKDWEQVKQDIMREGLKCKFGIAQLKQRLLQTGQAKLIEHSQKDKYWGDGGNGSGKNRLGKLLMQIRDMLKQK